MLTGNATLALRRIGLDRVIIDRGIVLERIVHTDPAGNPIEDAHDLGPSTARYAPTLGITRDGLMSGLLSVARAPDSLRNDHHLGERPSRSDRRWHSPTGRAASSTWWWERTGSARPCAELIHPAHRARIPVILRVADGHGVRAVGSGLPVKLHHRLLAGQLPGRAGSGVRVLADAPRRCHGPAPDERSGQLQGPGRDVPRKHLPLIQQQQDPARVIFVPVHEVRTPSSHQGRVAVIGDAAHAFSPLLAQGAAMAIEDAVALAESLADPVTLIRRCGPTSQDGDRGWRPSGPRSAAHPYARDGGTGHPGAAQAVPARLLGFAQGLSTS